MSKNEISKIIAKIHKGEALSRSHDEGYLVSSPSSLAYTKDKPGNS